ncbi:MAG: hypothetical protein RLZZ422_880 [Pseudomonadota bacterium]
MRRAGLLDCLNLSLMKTVTLMIGVFSWLIVTSTYASTTPEQRTLFQTAYAAAQQGKFDEVNSYSSPLKNYPLFPWLEYEYLKQNLNTVSPESVVSFTSRHPNSVMSDDLLERWAYKLAANNNWTGILDLIPPEHPSDALQCYRALAIGRSGNVEASLKLGIEITTLDKGGMPAPCAEVLGIMRQHNAVSDLDLWKRIELAMEDNQVTFAQAVAKLLPTSQQLMVDRWAEVRRAPETEVPKLFTEPDSPELRDLMVYGIKKLISKQEATAQNLWSQAQSKFPFNGAQSGKVESELGLWDAYRQDTSALMRLRSIPDEYRTQDGNEWMVRIALRQDAWDDVLKAINSMKGDATLDTTWRYWKARALSALGKNEEASTLFNELAQDATFYGFLAADQLGQRYNPLQAAPPDRTQRVNGIKRLAAYERWQEWLALGNREMARKEWFRLVKAMDKIGVQSAAQLANELGDPNLAIWTVSKTKDWNAVDVRFPVYFEDLVTQSSQAQGVLPAWVLGVIRRESAFDQQARSSVNALGLMQLMPATARQVGKRLGLTLNANDDILHPATNVELGSAYLKEMLKRFDGDYARATAAYNAGPGRIPKWKPSRTLQADQWIESIPFEETRNYVQAVMAYTTVYDAKLQRGHALSLSSRLKPIAMD